MPSPTSLTRFATPDYRRRARPLNQALPATHRWIASLPDTVRPESLLAEYPRVANMLARAARDPLEFAAYLDMLLVDRRGGRRGFPAPVHGELLALRSYVEGCYPTASDARTATAPS